MSEAPLRIFISAGEQSGDGHGAALAKRLQELCPGVVLEGVGGPQMAAAGVEVHLDMVEHAAMGLVPVLKKLPFFRAALKDTAARLAANPYDVLVPIDYPGFNLRLSGRARKAGVHVCYYVSPQVWAWRPGRIHRIARLVDHMMVLFPFERDLYESVGVPCTFVGHPLFDELRLRKPSPAFRAGLGLDPDTPLVGILPGSRAQEIERNLPLQLQAASKVHAADPRVRFAIPVAKPRLRPLIQAQVDAHRDAQSGARGEVAAGLNVAILDGKASDVARVARAVVTVSGTATLELLHYQCPMVIVYQITAPQQWLAKRLLTTEWISLVNILAGREICPEYLASGDCSDAVARDLLALVRPGKARKRCLTHMRNLLEEVDQKGVHRRAAQAVLEVARAARAARPQV